MDGRKLEGGGVMTATAARVGGSDQRLAALLETLELTEFQKQVLRDRWLNQLGWMSRQASKARKWYLRLRIPVVIGGVAIPGLVTILLSAGSSETSVEWLFHLPVWVVRFVTFAVSLGVAILAALEEILNFGERWRHYRRTAELLKSLGWQYMMLSGGFRRYESHAAAFVPFTERVEDVLNEDVEGYLGQIAASTGERTRTEIIA
jgi:hypothetical protein